MSKSSRNSVTTQFLTQRSRNKHSRRRRLVFESLEIRELLTAAEWQVEAIYELADSDPWAKSPADVIVPASPANRIADFQLSPTNRWTSTATNGSGLQQGDPITLTWSIVPDTTSIFGFRGEATSNSNLRSFLGGIYGVTTNNANLQDEPWFPVFQNYLTRWSEVSGLTYVYEPNDDGLAFTQFLLPSGELGVRGDVRIAGHAVDGQDGSNSLAYNFFPNTGDTIIDTSNTIFYGNTSNNSIALRNVLSHEHGHGLGLEHVCPVVGTVDGRIMEPFVNLNFDGPQFDDILGVQRAYGDPLEKAGGNNTLITATDLGTLVAGQTVTRGSDANDNRVSPTETDFISIDDDSDVDLFRFIVPPGLAMNIELASVGPTYLTAAQDPITNHCPAGTSFNASSQSDLTLTLLSANGSTIQQVNNAGLGGTEQLTNLTLASGTYHIRVTGAQDAIQMYSLTIETTDTAPPATTSFTRLSPLGSPTNQDTLVFLATFSEAVIDVDADDFVITGTTGSIGVTANSASTFQISVSGGDLSGLNGVVGLDLSASPTITDIAGHPLPNTEPGVDETFLVDNNGPTTSSFTRKAPASPTTNANSLVFLATFNEPVVNVSPDDFQLTGASGTLTVQNITPTTYEITASGGTVTDFNGFVGLNFATSPTISDVAGNALTSVEPTLDESFVLDNVVPVATSFVRKSPASELTNGDSFVFLATFGEDVSGVGPNDFAISGATGAIQVTQLTATTFDVVISGGNLGSISGTVGLQLVTTPTITDGSGNALPGTQPPINESFLLDHAAPFAESFARNSPDQSPTNADTLSFRVTFSESVFDVDSDDFRAQGTTGTLTVLPVTTSMFDVTVSGGNLATVDGTVKLSFVELPTISDAAGNVLTDVQPAIEETYVVDNIAPEVLSFTRQSPAANPTSANSLSFLVTFDEAVTNVNASDFKAVGTSGVVSVASVTENTYEVTVSGGDLAILDGVVGLDFAAQPTIADLSGNAFIRNEPPLDETYLIDNTPPTSTSFTRKSPTSSSTNADVIEFLATFSEDVSGVASDDFSVSGTTGPITVAALTPSTYEVSITGGDLAVINGSVGLNFNNLVTITDVAGNPLSSSEPGLDEMYLMDNVPPQIISITRKNPATASTNADEIVFTATFSEAVLDIDEDDFTVNGTTAVIGLNPSSSTAYDITLSGDQLVDFNGTLELDIAPLATISDISGNALDPVEPFIDEAFLLDNLSPPAPQVTAVLSDTGLSSTDGVTNDSTLLVRGVSEPLGAVEVFLADERIGATDADIAGQWAFDYTATALADGQYPFTARVTDEVGNVSALSAIFVVQVDTSPPGVPTLVGVLTDTGLSAEDGITQDATLRLSGTAEPASTVTVFKGSLEVGTAVTDPAGSWSFDYTAVVLADGSYSFQVQSADMAGNSSAKSLLKTIVVDTVAPRITVLPQSTNSRTPTLRGTISNVSPGSEVASVMVTVDGNNLVATVDGSEWSVAVTEQLTDGHYDIQAKVTDLAGNQFTDAESDELLIDTVAPTVNNVTSARENGSFRKDAVVDISVLFGEVVIIEGSPQLELETGAVNQLATYLSGSGTDTLTFRYHVQAGDFSSDLDYSTTQALSVSGGTIKDHAGTHANLALPNPGSSGSLAANRDFVIDTTAPQADVLDVFPDPRVTAVDTVTIVFTESVSGIDVSDFVLTRNGENISLSGVTLSVDSESRYNLNLGARTSAPGDYVLRMISAESGIRDLAGNLVELDATDSWTVPSNLPPTDILLSSTAVFENTSGATIGQITVEDPNLEDVHTLEVEDNRFEIVDGTLKLLDTASLSRSESATVTLSISAADSGEPVQTFSKTFVLDVAAKPFPWQNIADRFDTTGDTRVVPGDVLVVVNQLNDPTILQQGGKLPSSRAANSLLPFYDVNGDGFCTTNDVLQLVNQLNGAGEGESSRAAQAIPLAETSLAIAPEAPFQPPADCSTKRYESQTIAGRAGREPIRPTSAIQRRFARSPQENRRLPEIPPQLEAILERIAEDIAGSYSLENGEGDLPTLHK